MEASLFVKNVLGEHLFNKYLDLKMQEWSIYNQTIHDWEVKNYL